MLKFFLNEKEKKKPCVCIHGNNNKTKKELTLFVCIQIVYMASIGRTKKKKDIREEKQTK